MTAEAFDPQAAEARLRAEADSWDTSTPVEADARDIPIIDVERYLSTGDAHALGLAADQLRSASEDVGFFQLIGHGVPTALIDEVFAATRSFHDQPVSVKRSILIDRPGWPLGGVGYLPVGERKLPRRAKGNLNEAFLLKSGEPDNNQWLPEDSLPGFRATVERYAAAVEQLAKQLLPIYAAALDLDAGFFGDAFEDPFWRLRLTRYPPGDRDPDEHGIAPHVDTTFFTLLLQDGPGLTIFHAQRERWLRVPVVEGAYVVNSGELLRQWSNDRFLSTRHFADNDGTTDRHSIPFFFNANADHRMVCLPTCHGPDNPPKYPPVSYRESQAVVQGE